MRIYRLIKIVIIGLLLLNFTKEVCARKFEPGKFTSTSYIHDRTGALKTDTIYRGGDNDEIRFTDKESGEIVYSVKYNNSIEYPIDQFSPDGKVFPYFPDGYWMAIEAALLSISIENCYDKNYLILEITHV